MPVLAPGRVFATREPRVRVENPLAPGSHVFRLTVLDEARNESAPVEITVRVQRGIDPGGISPFLRGLVRPERRGGPR